MNTLRRITGIIGAIMLVSCGGGGGTDSHGPVYDLDTLGVPKFVNTNYIDLSQLTSISRFRSSEGHDYSDSLESCRSMKHYFYAPDSTTAIYSPVAGTITKLYQEWAGTQIHIRADAQPAFTFIIFHITPNTFKVGDKVAEGQALGTHVGTQTNSDIAVEVNTGKGWRMVSYFETLTDAAFAAYSTRGIISLDQVVISKAERDENPLSCDGETFTNAGSDPLTKRVTF